MTKQAALARTALEQGGYFTAKQALAAGYTYPEQHQQVRYGKWMREQRGIYRLRDYPTPDRPDLILYTLMSPNRSGEPQAVASHETALAFHEISDANPARIHLTVPPGFRKKMPEGVVLHRAQLSEKDWEQHEGFRVTTPLRTILDAAASPATWVYLADAVYDALQRGLVRASQLLLAEVTEETKKRIHTAVEAAQERERRRIQGQ
jgi:predicted transcriptional regulator of viral defense system